MAATSITTAGDSHDGRSPKSSIAANRASTSSSSSSAAAASRQSPRRPQLRLQHRQQSMQDRQDGGEEDDEVTLCSPSCYPDRRCNGQSPRLPDHRPDEQQQQPPSSDQRRPASSRSHLRYWHRQRARSRSSSFKHVRPWSDGPLQQSSDSQNSMPSMSMTRKEFEALPPTIQRKCFSTLERLRFAQNPSGHSVQSLNAGRGLLDQYPSSASPTEEDIRRPPLKARLASDPLIVTPHRRSRVHSTLACFHASPADKAHGRTIDGEEKHPATSHSCHKSVILDATDEALVKMGKRQSPLLKLDSSNRREADSPQQPCPTMHNMGGDEPAESLELARTAESMAESFRWLEEDDDLDLRLCIDDDYSTMYNEVQKKEGWGLSFRRHLSVSKLSFARPSDASSRPGNKGTLVSPTFSGSFMSSLPCPNLRARRKSRALSLVLPNKSPVPDAAAIIDTAASHYQDPDARMKLRVYLASPHKFDEAIEFGFPSIEVKGNKDSHHTRPFVQEESINALARLQTSIDDEITSMSSNPTSPTDSGSPRTPESMNQPSPMRSLPMEAVTPTKIDHAHAPASSREMTLRMTLTRPDLRASKEQDYDSQQSAPAGRKLRTQGGPVTPRPHTLGTTSKDNMERQFSAVDQNNLAHDDGVVKRFWNRVRRS